MKRTVIALTIAAAAVVGLRAQDVKQETKIKADDAKTVVYSGCLATGEEKTTYILENAVPVKETKSQTTVGATGAPETTTTTTMKYVLVPAGKVEFQQNVGHKVEVTAMVVPAGDDKTKIETKTKTEVQGRPDAQTKTTEKVAQGDMPQLRVVSIKHLADRCEAH
jgi:hypothetical protein